MAFTTVTMTQDFTLADATEPSGTVTFTPNSPLYNGSVVVPATPVVARLDSAGTISIPLVATTDPATTPAGAAYRVDELINGIVRRYYIQVPHDQGSPLVLYALVQLATPPGLSFPATALTRVAINTQSGSSYTLVLADAGRAVHSTGSSAFTLTVPANATAGFSLGDIVVVTQYGTGQVTLSPAGGVTIRTASSLTTRAQYSEVSLRKIGTDEWLVAGDTT